MGGNFRKLLGASLFGNIADGVSLIALPWYASTITDDAVAVAAVVTAGRVPWLLAMVAGVLGDRMDRRRLMVIAGTVRAVLYLALAGLAAGGVRSLSLVFVIALAIGFAEVCYDNTSQAITPSVVPADRLERANGTLWGVEEAANRFLGPPLGGVLVAASLGLAFSVQAGFGLAGVLLLVMMPGSFRPTGAPRVDGAGEPARVSPRVMLVEGWRWLWAHRLLRRFAITLGIVNAAGAIPLGVLVLYAQEVLGLSPAGLGAVLTAAAVGGVVGSQVAAFLAPRIPPGMATGGCLLVEAICWSAIGLVPNVPVFVVASAASGFAVPWWNIVTVSLRQRLIPDELLSRVNSVYRTFGWGMIAIGGVLGGVLVDVAEPLVGRVDALRVPYLVAAAIVVLLLVCTRRTLGTRAIRAALAAADTRPPESVHA